MKAKVIGAITLAGSMMFNPAMAAETVSAVGSNSVTPLMEVLGETYGKTHDVVVEVQGPGSSAGIRTAHDGSADLGMSSRDLKSSEKASDITEVVIARDGIAVVVNNSNPVKDLSKEQISQIYKGEITNWKQVGGEDKPIVVATRDTASGTRGAFEDIMSLKRKINGKSVTAISQRAQVASGNGQLKTMVASNPFAIGYISLGSVDGSVKPLSIDGHAPSVEAIKAGDYGVQRPFLVLYKDGRPSKEALEFLNWIKTADAQALVAKEGYVSVL
ncbi:phosphate ABC transporter substrate-binding protein [Photobacterium halotolerans]|uniref:Phosphate-binding protein n=1 Tax=Photobacterium halotolerans TaxID=265726 RepID=A0A7X4WEQ4_9GAMM|nr:phosphate ABC transporter substrate-binding protein [Photobacterium halotolerans]NAW67386.1 phosphate ABC transporter substrate-binding protein PstS family protein [Photobacterium halotolerans]NAW85578.1 phosphate ABC transporter substrate-binding protein PstS family protein [Photobacterium halotolerans]